MMEKIVHRIGHGELYAESCLDVLKHIPSESVQSVIADPPYFQVLTEHEWDNVWSSPEAYVEWTEQWVMACQRVLKPDGLIFIFGQHGKREHVWLHVCSHLSKIMQFHDLLVWDRAVGYNERRDSFTPQYEMILVLRNKRCERPYFDKDAVRIPYDEETIQSYMRDNRYKDKKAREAHLRKGKYATNILRVPSLKGSSLEKVGHPSQKPLELIRKLIAASSRAGDTVLDPFMGSGTTAVAAEQLSRLWIGMETDTKYIHMMTHRLEGHLSSHPLFGVESSGTGRNELLKGKPKKRSDFVLTGDLFG